MRGAIRVFMPRMKKRKRKKKEEEEGEKEQETDCHVQLVNGITFFWDVTPCS
jgi:hypothetical protein